VNESEDHFRNGARDPECSRYWAAEAPRPVIALALSPRGA